MASLSQWGGWNPEFKAEIADFMRVGIEVCGGKATQNSLHHRGRVGVGANQMKLTFCRPL